VAVQTPLVSRNYVTGFKDDEAAKEYGHSRQQEIHEGLETRSIHHYPFVLMGLWRNFSTGTAAVSTTRRTAYITTKWTALDAKMYSKYMPGYQGVAIVNSATTRAG